MKNLETIVIISTILIIILLTFIYFYRKKYESYGRYEKLKNFETNSVNNLLRITPVMSSRALPPSQPFVPSPEMKHPIPYESYLFTYADTFPSTEFKKMNYAYAPSTMSLPPVVKRDRLLPPGQQPLDPYSGFPVSMYKADGDINKFYPQFVPDSLWCRDGVCG